MTKICHPPAIPHKILFNLNKILKQLLALNSIPIKLEDIKLKLNFQFFDKLGFQTYMYTLILTENVKAILCIDNLLLHCYYV